MPESADTSRSGSRAPEAAVVCDGNSFNVRFLRAAMEKLGFAEVVTTRTVSELVREAVAHRARVVVFDPSMQGGMGVDAVGPLQRGLPDALLVAFCADAAVSKAVADLGVVTVTKASMSQLDTLVATIEEKLGRTAEAQPEGIPVADLDTPVWDLVPSLVDPDNP